MWVVTFGQRNFLFIMAFNENDCAQLDYNFYNEVDMPSEASNTWQTINLQQSYPIMSSYYSMIPDADNTSYLCDFSSDFCLFENRSRYESYGDWSSTFNYQQQTLLTDSQPNHLKKPQHKDYHYKNFDTKQSSTHNSTSERNCRKRKSCHQLTTTDAPKRQRFQHSCNICLKSFSSPSALQNHNRIHTGEKPHKCVICQQAFADRSTLTKHKRVHTGAKPYQCAQCKKAFSQSGNLIRHFKKFHKHV